MYPISNTYVAPSFFIGVIPLVPLVDWISRGDGKKKAAGFGHILPLGKASTWSSSPPAADSFSPAPHAELTTRDSTRDSDALKKGEGITLPQHVLVRSTS